MILHRKHLFFCIHSRRLSVDCTLYMQPDLSYFHSKFIRFEYRINIFTELWTMEPMKLSHRKMFPIITPELVCHWFMTLLSGHFFFSPVHSSYTLTIDIIIIIFFYGTNIHYSCVQMYTYTVCTLCSVHELVMMVKATWFQQFRICTNYFHIPNYYHIPEKLISFSWGLLALVVIIITFIITQDD